MGEVKSWRDGYVRFSRPLRSSRPPFGLARSFIKKTANEPQEKNTNKRKWTKVFKSEFVPFFYYYTHTALQAAAR